MIRSAEAAPNPDHRAGAWPVYLVAWLPLVAVDVTMAHAQGLPLATALRYTMWVVLPLASLGVAVVRISESLAARSVPGGRRIAVHAGLAVLFAVTATALTYALTVLDRVCAGASQPYRYDRLIAGWQALQDALVYAAIAGVTHARAQSRLAQAESMRAARAEALRAQADLALLRSQLNPHFVMNVLHSLVGLVRRDPALAERALEDLGGLLAHGLRLSRDDADRVPLREEWAFLATYLELEKMRLGERLDLTLEADPGALELAVPSFSLQPLVENAVLHAIAPRARGGKLEVRARLEGDRLLLRVADDGPGLGASAANGGGLGLRLLRERLQALYPGREVLRLEAAPGGGLVASLALPIERAEA